MPASRAAALYVPTRGPRGEGLSDCHYYEQYYEPSIPSAWRCGPRGQGFQALAGSASPRGSPFLPRGVLGSPGTVTQRLCKLGLGPAEQERGACPLRPGRALGKPPTSRSVVLGTFSAGGTCSPDTEPNVSISCPPYGLCPSPRVRAAREGSSPSPVQRVLASHPPRPRVCCARPPRVFRLPLPHGPARGSFLKATQQSGPAQKPGSGTLCPAQQAPPRAPLPWPRCGCELGASRARPDMSSGNRKGERREKPPSLFDNVWESQGVCVMANHSGLTWGALGVPPRAKELCLLS